MMQTHNRRFRVSSTVSVAAMAEGAVLMDNATGECFELNRIGARVWECLARGEDLDRTVEAIASDCGVSRSVVSEDTSKLLAELARRRIVVAVP